MKVPQGNSLYSYLKQTKMSFFFFTESENRKAKQIQLRGGGEGVDTSGKGEGGEERVWEDEYGANTVCMYVNGK
jgi:hypothetical protein